MTGNSRVLKGGQYVGRQVISPLYDKKQTSQINMMRPKRKTDSHIIGDQAVKHVINLLPDEWTIRELTPDYGIDLQIELFEKTATSGTSKNDYDTLGEQPLPL